jgi:hypothetical protein
MVADAKTYLSLYAVKLVGRACSPSTVARK